MANTARIHDKRDNTALKSGQADNATRAVHDAAKTITHVQEQPRTPGREYKRLQVFVGEWKMEGQQYDGPFGGAATITTAETYEWLPGGRFLVHRLEGHVGANEIACIEIIGYDASSRSYSVRSFYNDGNSSVMQALQRDTTWTYTGDWKTNGQPLKVRCTVVVNRSGNAMKGKWEYSSDGSIWQKFWDAKATKA